MGPIEGWGNVWGTSVTVPVTISTSLYYFSNDVLSSKTKMLFVCFGKTC